MLDKERLIKEANKAVPVYTFERKNYLKDR